MEYWAIISNTELNQIVFAIPKNYHY